MIVVIQKFLVAALVAAPIALAPMNVDAQQRGADRAQQARAEGPAAASQASQAPDRPEPRGLKKAFEGRTPPAVLQRAFPGLFGTPAPEPVVEPEPAPEPEPDAVQEPCDITFDPVNFVFVDCNGNVAG
jgi:hypothetical protein